MNSPTQSHLNDLYRHYLSCVDINLHSFLASKPAATAAHSNEWCTNEKTAYFDYMRTNFKTQYDNIIRLESQNY